MNTHSNAPRVAVTDFMAHFGGPKRRAWRWRLHSRDAAITLRDLTLSARSNYEPARFRQKNMRGLHSSLWVALEQWHAFPFSKLKIKAERAATVFSSSKGDLFWLESDYQRWQAGRERKWNVPHLGWTCDCPWFSAGVASQVPSLLVPLARIVLRAARN